MRNFSAAVIFAGLLAFPPAYAQESFDDVTLQTANDEVTSVVPDGIPDYITIDRYTYNDPINNCGETGGGDEYMSAPETSADTQSSGPTEPVNCLDSFTYDWRPDTKVQKKWYTIRNVRRSQTVTITVAGSYNISVTAEGQIKIARVTAGGNVTVSANATYSSNWNICASFKDENLQYYLRYHKWKVYSNGSATKTNVYRDEPQNGGYLNRQVAKMSGWNAC
ncbi:hypothetical protein [Deinococcus murrayi]|uniref:hypothetical protein n=1 Tax=Deinococcus murrayi TaxID=68910 RepID=UPI000A70236C|nr:hypothetical protein [Deinococcus murrayi]